MSLYHTAEPTAPVEFSTDSIDPEIAADDSQLIENVETETVTTDEYNGTQEPLNLFHREVPSLTDGEAWYTTEKQFTASFHDWGVLNAYDESSSIWTWFVNHPVFQAISQVFTFVLYVVLSFVKPQFLLRILSPPIHTFHLHISNKKVVVKHLQKFNKLEERSTRTDALVKDFVGSSITVQNVSRPFFFANESYIRGKWNRIGVFTMYIWLFITGLLQYLMALPGKAGYAFASLLLINFLLFCFVHFIWLIVIVIRHKEFVKRRMQPIWQTIVFFTLLFVVFIFNMIGFKNKPKDYVSRPYYSAYPALLIFIFTFMNFYPRVSFGSYAELTMSYKSMMSGLVQQRVLLSIDDAEKAKYELEKVTKYHD